MLFGPLTTTDGLIGRGSLGERYYMEEIKKKKIRACVKISFFVKKRRKTNKPPFFILRRRHHHLPPRLSIHTYLSEPRIKTQTRDASTSILSADLWEREFIFEEREEEEARKGFASCGWCNFCSNLSGALLCVFVSAEETRRNNCERRCLPPRRNSPRARGQE